MIERDLRIAQYTGGRVHIQHISTARGMEIIRRFKEEGVRVTAEGTQEDGTALPEADHETSIRGARCEEPVLRCRA